MVLAGYVPDMKFFSLRTSELEENVKVFVEKVWWFGKPAVTLYSTNNITKLFAL